MCIEIYTSHYCVVVSYSDGMAKLKTAEGTDNINTEVSEDESSHRRSKR